MNILYIYIYVLTEYWYIKVYKCDNFFARFYQKSALSVFALL